MSATGAGRQEAPASSVQLPWLDSGCLWAPVVFCTTEEGKDRRHLSTRDARCLRLPRLRPASAGGQLDPQTLRARAVGDTRLELDGAERGEMWPQGTQDVGGARTHLPSRPRSSPQRHQPTLESHGRSRLNTRQRLSLSSSFLAFVLNPCPVSPVIPDCPVGPSLERVT